MQIQDMINTYESRGYSPMDSRARVCQDIVLKAISSSSLSRNVTVKGGVVMRSITGNVRRATQDMDIDFIKYPLLDDFIIAFIQKINCLPDVSIEQTGEITELKQQDYHGKSTHIIIRDSDGTSIESKIDLGVHKRFEIEQEEYCFDIAYDDEGASLLINSKEQMFTEKLRSLLKFGRFSTRYKDIFDMYYFCDKLDSDKLKACYESYIYSDAGMRENNINDIIRRVNRTFMDENYRKMVDTSDKKWLDDGIDDVFNTIIRFLESLT